MTKTFNTFTIMIKDKTMKERMDISTFWKYQEEMNKLGDGKDTTKEDDTFIYVYNSLGCLIEKYDKLHHFLYVY